MPNARFTVRASLHTRRAKAPGEWEPTVAVFDAELGDDYVAFAFRTPAGARELVIGMPGRPRTDRCQRRTSPARLTPLGGPTFPGASVPLCEHAQDSIWTPVLSRFDVEPPEFPLRPCDLAVDGLELGAPTVCVTVAQAQGCGS